MKNKHVLITGGAGFIGSFLTDALINKGDAVRILDNLETQVHQGKKPKYLNKRAEFIQGDVRNYSVFEKSLDGIDIIFHLAARVGVAQSNYEIKDYMDVNVGGMTNLLNIVVNKKTTVKKILMTASMTSYGEGNYFCKSCGIVKPELRTEKQLREKDWNIYCSICRKVVYPVATTEEASLNNNSIYALSKNVQEEMLMHIGKIYSIPVVSMRCFNVYGPRQSISNPYTGVTAIFISRLKNNQQPVIYEDGMQTRDFVSVHDVVRALVIGMMDDKINYNILNIGSGIPTSIMDIANTLQGLMQKKIKPITNGEFRKNDIRNCFADISRAKIFGWEPEVSLDEGMKELIKWSKKEESIDVFERAERELRSKRLL